MTDTATGTNLSQKLADLPTDKDKVKLLLKTMGDAITMDDSHQRITLTSYCVGYLGSILVLHDLNDWES